eukprot:COSAG04_NODE_19245_length_421_cov_0.614907_2_plen_112_part_01
MRTWISSGGSTWLHSLPTQASSHRRHFQGDGTDLYALPTVAPTLGKSLVQDALPLEYERNPIAIGTTGMRRFRKVGTPALGRDGPAPGEGRDTSKYYNLVPSMPSQPADADA